MSRRLAAARRFSLSFLPSLEGAPAIPCRDEDRARRSQGLSLQFVAASWANFLRSETGVDSKALGRYPLASTHPDFGMFC